MSITVAVDPGLHGAIALLDGPGTLVAVHGMPTVDKIVSAQELNLLEGWRVGDFGTVVIEDVHSMPKQGVSSTFNFGVSKGIVIGVFAGNNRPITYVSPQRWKRALGLAASKDAARRRAQELWPDRADWFKWVKDDGRAEAALIGYWYLTKGDGR